MQPQLTIIVHGPQACGKTRNAERLRKGFNLDSIIDDWNGRSELPKRGALVLTTLAPPAAGPWPLHWYSFDDAMQLVTP